MSERPFMQLYVSDFVGDTMDLSTEQVGAYLLLLMAMWNAGGELKNDATKLARVARLPADYWAAVWSDLLPYFDVADGKVTHGRLAKELAKFAKKSAARSEAGKRGVEAKALKKRNSAQAIASGLLKHSPETRKKNARSATGPTEGVVLDRWADEHLFKACEAVTGETVPDYMQRQIFPAYVVAAARQAMAEQSNSGAVH